MVKFGPPRPLRCLAHFQGSALMDGVRHAHEQVPPSLLLREGKYPKTRVAKPSTGILQEALHADFAGSPPRGSCRKPSAGMDLDPLAASHENSTVQTFLLFASC